MKKTDELCRMAHEVRLRNSLDALARLEQAVEEFEDPEPDALFQTVNHFMESLAEVHRYVRLLPLRLTAARAHHDCWRTRGAVPCRPTRAAEALPQALVVPRAVVERLDAAEQNNPEVTTAPSRSSTFNVLHSPRKRIRTNRRPLWLMLPSRA